MEREAQTEFSRKAFWEELGQASRQTHKHGSPVPQTLLFQVEMKQLVMTAHHYPLTQSERRGSVLPSYPQPTLPLHKVSPGRVWRQWTGHSKCPGLWPSKGSAPMELRVGSVGLWPIPAPIRTDPSPA